MTNQIFKYYTESNCYDEEATYKIKINMIYSNSLKNNVSLHLNRIAYQFKKEGSIIYGDTQCSINPDKMIHNENGRPQPVIFSLSAKECKERIFEFNLNDIICNVSPQLINSKKFVVQVKIPTQIINWVISETQISDIHIIPEQYLAITCYGNLLNAAGMNSSIGERGSDNLFD